MQKTENLQSLLEQALKELEVKNRIIEKFTVFKEKLEEVKEQEIENIREIFEQQREREKEYFNEQISELKDELEQEKRHTDELMDMIGHKLSDDSMMEVSQEQINEYKDKIRQRDEIINQVQERNIQLSKRLDQVCNE